MISAALRYVIASPVFHRWHPIAEEEGFNKNIAGLLTVALAACAPQATGRVSPPAPATAPEAQPAAPAARTEAKPPSPAEAPAWKNDWARGAVFYEGSPGEQGARRARLSAPLRPRPPHSGLASSRSVLRSRRSRASAAASSQGGQRIVLAESKRLSGREPFNRNQCASRR